MTTEPGGRISDADLMAYLDHSLHATRAAEIEATLDADPDARSRLAEWRHQNALINSLYEPVAAEPVPARLNIRRMAGERQVARQSWQRMAAAAVICLAIGGSGGWYLGHPRAVMEGGAGSDPIAEAMAAHRLYAEDIAHPVTVAGNSAGALRHLAFQAPRPEADDSEFGTGGLAACRRQPASRGGPSRGAQIMYEDGAGRRLTLFFTACRTAWGQHASLRDPGRFERHELDRREPRLHDRRANRAAGPQTDCVRRLRAGELMQGQLLQFGNTTVTLSRKHDFPRKKYRRRRKGGSSLLRAARLDCNDPSMQPNELGERQGLQFRHRTDDERRQACPLLRPVRPTG